MSILLLSLLLPVSSVSSQTGGSMYVSDKLYQLQQEFLKLRFGMFIHFSMSTFQETEWADPQASPEEFSPTGVDCEQWARAAKSAGMTYGCLTTKHHDGFALWDSKVSTHDVANSSFKKDIVKMYADAFRANGLKVCFYYSILDLHENIKPRYITWQHVEIIKEQLKELLTNYGEITAIVFDGWDAPWSRISYDDIPFDEIYLHIKSLQPNCLVMDMNAAKYPSNQLYYSDIRQYEQRAGQRISAKTNSLPSQSSPTLQKAWFWKKSFPTDEMKSVDMVINKWLRPFNQGYCNLLLNIAPNRDGKIDQNALDRFKEIGEKNDFSEPLPLLPRPRRPIISKNLAKFMKYRTSSKEDSSGADMVNNDDWRGRSWISRAKDKTPWFEVIFEKPEAFNTIAFSEPLHYRNYKKNRIKSYKLQYNENSEWKDIIGGSRPQNVQMNRFYTVIAKKVRIFISEADPEVGLSEFEVYLEPDIDLQ